MRRLILAVFVAIGVGLAAPALAEEPARQVTRQHEVLQHRPSGFWTSNRPSEHGAYRWRLLGLGTLIAAGTGYMMYRLIRRGAAQRTTGRAKPSA